MRLGDFGGVDEHLGRDAPDVEARTTEGAVFAERHPLVGMSIVENAIARTGSDDRDVVGFHAVTPFRTMPRRRCCRCVGSRPARDPVPDTRPREAPAATKTHRVWRRRTGTMVLRFPIQPAHLAIWATSRTASPRCMELGSVVSRTLWSDRRIRLGTPTSRPRCNRAWPRRTACNHPTVMGKPPNGFHCRS